MICCSTTKDKKTGRVDNLLWFKKGCGNGNSTSKHDRVDGYFPITAHHEFLFLTYCITKCRPTVASFAQRAF